MPKNYALEFDRTGLSETEQALIQVIWAQGLMLARLANSKTKPSDPATSEHSVRALRAAFPGRTFDAKWIGSPEDDN